MSVGWFPDGYAHEEYNYDEYWPDYGEEILKTVTKSVKNKALFSFSCTFNVDKDGGLGQVWVYPDPDTQLLVQLSDDSITLLKQIRQQILTWMEQTHEYTGTVVEKWQKQQVVIPESQVEQFVQVS